MKRQKHIKWNKLDNAAKLFPCTSTKRDTKVFRFACQLREQVDPAVLQEAADLTLEVFPFYTCVLKRGIFWYYFEQSALRAKVKQEQNPPCSPIFDKNVKSLLFEITYFQDRISVETYHALTDGTGALQFLRMLVYHYLTLRHPDAFRGQLAGTDYDASLPQKEADSFQKYFSGKTEKRAEKLPKAYRFHGAKTAECRLKVIEGILPVSKVLACAHDYGTTLTVFLTAVFMCSVALEMTEREKEKPVVVQVPVNLRNYFQSETARNFFGLIHASYDFKNNSGEMAAVIAYLVEFFKTELTPEKLSRRQMGFTTLEHNLFARITPLFLKDIFMRLFADMAELENTAAISNIGRVQMPPELAGYIRLFDVFASTRKKQLCICSFEDNLTVSITSTFVNSEVEKNFFRILTGMGISVELVTNKVDEE